MLLRWMGEAVLGSGLSLVELGKAEAAEKKLTGGKALSVRAMVSRQMIFALVHRKIKELTKVRS